MLLFTPRLYKLSCLYYTKQESNIQGKICEKLYIFKYIYPFSQQKTRDFSTCKLFQSMLFFSHEFLIFINGFSYILIQALQLTTFFYTCLAVIFTLLFLRHILLSTLLWPKAVTYLQKGLNIL